MWSGCRTSCTPRGPRPAAAIIARAATALAPGGLLLVHDFFPGRRSGTHPLFPGPLRAQHAAGHTRRTGLQRGGSPCHMLAECGVSAVRRLDMTDAQRLRHPDGQRALTARRGASDPAVPGAAPAGQSRPTSASVGGGRGRSFRVYRSAPQGAASLEFVIRESYRDGAFWKSRDLFCAGGGPRQLSGLPGGQRFLRPRGGNRRSGGKRGCPDPG